MPVGDIGSWMADTLKVVTFRLINAVRLVPSSCQTPNIDVKMGRYRYEDIPENGSPSKNISFSLKLNNCPEGITSVNYTLIPASSSASQNDIQGVVNLNPNSTAKGFGLQITDSNLKPIALNQAQKFAEYSSSGGNFTIPLNARYVRIASGSGVSPGMANAEITFSVEYQ